MTQISVFPAVGTEAHARIVPGDKPINGLGWIKAAQRATRKAVPGTRGITYPKPTESPYLWTAIAVDRKGVAITDITIVAR